MEPENSASTLPTPKALQVKKRHHFVPKAYLQAFTNEAGRVLAYLKDKPNEAFLVTPDSTGFERYYYSQPTPDGGVDHNRLEDLFCELEGLWPPIVKRLYAREAINDSLETLFQFILLQRVRVPASRDATEARLAAEVQLALTDMRMKGQLPRPPSGLEGLWDNLIVSIDPHRSILGMVEDIQASESLFSRLGLRLVHNKTSTSFLASDNPVIWFDPSLAFERQSPYGIRADGPVQLLFPISPSMLVLGLTDLAGEFGMHGLLHGEVTDEDWVLGVNLNVCRYAYRAVYASAPGQEQLIQAFSDQSPVWQAGAQGGQFVFGRREDKPKWTPRD